MSDFITPEVMDCARRIVKNALGTQAEILSVKQSWSGIYNKLFYIESNEGDFFIKAQCKKIFPSTRIGQIENEVEGYRLFQQADILCPNILAHDLTGGNEIGVPYIFYEPIYGEILWELLNHMGDTAQLTEIKKHAFDVYEHVVAITNTHFGSLSSSGLLGWHKTWDDYYRAAFNILIQDCINIDLFTDEELAIVRAAGNQPLVYTGTYCPTFQHSDLASQNMIWGHIRGKPDELYVIDFGNAIWGLPRFDEYMIKQEGAFGTPPCDITTLYNLDKRLYNNLLLDFQKMLWKETQKLTEEYAHCYPWFITDIEAAKQDTSRDHVLIFVEKCRKEIYDNE